MTRIYHRVNDLLYRCTQKLSPALLICFLSPTFSQAQAQDTYELGIAPVSHKWVKTKPKTKLSKSSTLSEDEIKDPKKLLAFLRSRPEAIDPSRMTPFIAVEVGQTLLYGGEVRKAIELLNTARDKWPNDLQILQAWARSLIKSGQPSYVRSGIEAWRTVNPTAQVDSYTQYLYALSIYLEGPQTTQNLTQTITLIDKLLSTDPTYVGPDGINAARLRSFKEELVGRLSSAQP